MVATDAIEIKWRDATTDGDHITKEHTRLKTVKNAGFHPVRVMFYYPTVPKPYAFSRRSKHYTRDSAANIISGMQHGNS